MSVENKILATAEVISKTVQTLIGNVINVGYHSHISLFIKYTKGDETGLTVQAHVQRTAAADIAQTQGWSTAAGVKTATLNSYTMTTAVQHVITLDVRGIEFIKFTQGGSSNDGTPTGVYSASYTLE